MGTVQQFGFSKLYSARADLLATSGRHPVCTHTNMPEGAAIIAAQIHLPERRCTSRRRVVIYHASQSPDSHPIASVSLSIRPHQRLPGGG